MRRVAWLLAVLLLAAATGCASSRPRQPKPPEDPELARLTEWLKLDAKQQAKTRQLLDQLAERNAGLKEKWERQHRVRQEDLLVSRSIFLQDFIAILNDKQRRLFAEANLKMQETKGRARPF